jgi:hypothetical protein
MHIEQKLKTGRRRRLWVGKRPVVVVERAGRQTLLFRPRLARALGFTVGGRVVLDLLPDGSLALALASRVGRGLPRAARRAKRA